MRVLVVLVGVIAFTTVCDAWTFDCRREAGLCQNGGTCSSTDGTCTCVDAAVNSGYDCSVVVADEAHADCAAAPCLNGGTCHKAAGSADPVTCLCTPEYTGATCDTNRIELTCDSTLDTMTVEIRPIVGTFGGVAFVKDQTDASCELSGTGTDADPLLLSALSNTDTTCGATTDAVVDGDTQKTRVLIVAFLGADLLTSRDIMIYLTCGTDSVLSKTTTAIEVTSVVANLQEEERGNVPVDGDVDFTFEANGAAITAAIDLGTEVTITADLTADGLARFEQLRFKSCAIGSHVDDTDAAYVERNLLDAFCPHADLQTLLTQPTSRTGTTVSFAFSAFKYDVSDNLVVTCVIEVCATGADCDPALCTGDTVGSETGFGRKKREAGTIDKILQRNIAINDPLLAAANSLNEFKETKACYQSWEMTATVVALSVALLICLLICIILVIKAILNRRQRGDVYREDMSEAASTTHLPHLPTIVSNKA